MSESRLPSRWWLSPTLYSFFKVCLEYSVCVAAHGVHGSLRSCRPFFLFSLRRNRNLQGWKQCGRAERDFLFQLSSIAAFWDVTVGNKIYSLYPELKKEASPKWTQLKGVFCGFYLLWVIKVTSLCYPCSAGYYKPPRTELRPQWVLDFHKTTNTFLSFHTSRVCFAAGRPAGQAESVESR